MLILIRKFLVFSAILLLCVGIASASQDAGDSLAADVGNSSSQVQSVADNYSEPLQDSGDNDVVEICEGDVLTDDGEFVDASEAYDCLNEFRCEEGVWQWNQDDSTRTFFNTNDTLWPIPLVRDAELEQTARIRAKEISQVYDHFRPDGTYFFTAFPEGLVEMGENIAAGYYTAAGVTEAWKETDEPYKDQGHRRNMLDSRFNCVGIAGYRIGGVTYWVQNFACRYNPAAFDSSNVFAIEANNTANPRFKIELPKYASGYFAVNISGHEVMRKAVFQGKADITIYGLDAGSYDVEMIYEGDSNYIAVNKTDMVNTTGDASSSPSFTYLNTLIKMGGGDVRLQKDYTFDEVTDSDFKDGIIITDSVTIDGQGHSIDAGGLARIFQIVPDSTLKNIRLLNGASDNGGAILSLGLFQLFNCTFINNTASARGGAIYEAQTQVHIHASTFINNSAQLNGGAVFGEMAVIVKQSSFVANRAGSLAGAVYAQGALNSENSNYTNNTNLQKYSPMYMCGNGNVEDDEYSLIFKNATHDNGEVNIDRDLTATQTILINASGVVINGNGHTINAKNRTRIFFITGNDITIRNITLVGGCSIGEGGAIYAGDSNITVIDAEFRDNRAETGAAIFTGNGNVMVSGSRFSDNTASAGGAIFSDSGNVTVTDSAFTNDDASSHAGAIYTTGSVSVTRSVFAGCDAGLYGGVIFTNGKQFGRVYIRDSVFENNTSHKDGGVFISSLGAEISNSSFKNNSAANEGGVMSTWGDVTLTDSTFTANHAGKNGAMKVTGDAYIRGCDFTGNYADSESAAVNAKNVDVAGSTFAGNVCADGRTFSGNVKASNTTVIENGKDVSGDYISDYVPPQKPSGNDSLIPPGNDNAPKTVRKAVKITAKKKTFKAKAKSKKYSITLKSAKNPIGKVRVVLKIKGKTFRATTNAKGVGTFKIKLSKKGTFKAKITFAGNKYYLKASKTVKIRFR